MHQFEYKELELNSYIAAMLGLSETKLSRDKYENTVYEKYVPAFNYGKTRMFIYFDIIENQYVGDQMAPLEGEDNKIATIDFKQIQYIPI